MVAKYFHKLVFVYNANAGLGNSILDSAHKIFSPATYNCNLCDITFGVFKENAVWKKFREETDLKLEFLHKDEFKEQFPKSEVLNNSLPVVFALISGAVEVIMSAEELNAMKTAEELIRSMKKKLEV